MNYRHQEILKAHSESGNWIFNHESYLQWKLEDHGLLWIEGKPGSGKSTLMKKILQSFDLEKPSRQVVLSFYFHGRGQPLQYNQHGMLRTILHQLVRQVPSVRAELKRMWEEKSRLEGVVHWRLEELHPIFSSSLLAAGKDRTVNILVDALDEVDEGPARELPSYFHQLGDEIRSSEVSVRICFSCRKYPRFAIKGAHHIFVDDENRTNMETYIDAELARQIDQWCGDEGALDKLRAEMAEKASGVFLWVHLVIPVVAKQYNDGENLDFIRKKLEKVPSDLHHIYRHIFTEVVDPEKRPRTLLLMQWVFLGARQPSVTEMRHAMASDDSVVRHGQYSIEESLGFINNDAQMNTLIVSLSGGLAEVGPRKHVQFIHESVNDFLREDGFRCLGFMYDDDSISEGHYRLCLSCLNYLKPVEIRGLEKPWTPIGLHRGLEERFPLIEYATRLWTFHAERARLRGLPLQMLIQRLEWPSRIDLYYGHFGRGPWGREYYVDATLLHVASRLDLVSMVQALLKKGADIDGPDDVGNTALHYAVFGNLGDVFGNPTTPNPTCVHLLLENGANVNAQDKKSSTALHSAASRGDPEIAEMLIHWGATLDVVSNLYGTPLQTAACGGGEKILDSWLETRAAVYGQESLYGSAWHAVVVKSPYGTLNHTAATVQLLLKYGAPVNAEGRALCGTPLQEAASWVKETTLRKLLNAGADVNAQGVGGCGTPLHEAARWGGESCLRVLLEAGANVEMRSERHVRSVLQLARKSERDREAKLKLLLRWKYGKRWLARTRNRPDKA